MSFTECHNLFTSEQDGITPLTTACKLGYTDAVLALLDANADVNLPEEVQHMLYT